MVVTLAATLHDPEGRLCDQVERMLPVLMSIFGGLTIQASTRTAQPSLSALISAGAVVQRGSPDHDRGLAYVGRARRDAMAMALHLDTPLIMYADCDRILHWAEQYASELREIVAHDSPCDCLILGRTQRAFASHPRVQRDTEAIINQVFAAVIGHPWDITGAARLLSRRAALAIVQDCPDDSIGTDASWPLFLERAGGFSLSYRATEGLEFETADRYADAISAAGSLQAWLSGIDADPEQWLLRLDLARSEVQAMAPYTSAATTR